MQHDKPRLIIAGSEDLRQMKEDEARAAAGLPPVISKQDLLDGMNHAFARGLDRGRLETLRLLLPDLRACYALVMAARVTLDPAATVTPATPPSEVPAQPGAAGALEPEAADSPAPETLIPFRRHDRRRTMAAIDRGLEVMARVHDNMQRAAANLAAVLGEASPERIVEATADTRPRTAPEAPPAPPPDGGNPA